MDAVELDRIGRFEASPLRPQMQDKLELDPCLPRDRADCSLDESLRATSIHLSVLRRCGGIRDEWLELLFNRSIQFETEPLAYHLDRLGKTDVAGDASVRMSPLELVLRVADTEPQMDVFAAADHVHDSPTPDG